MSYLTNYEKTKINDFREIYRKIMNVNNNPVINDVVNALFLNVEKYYLEYKDEITSVSVSQEPYKFHILQPVNGEYSLLDFLINRAITNIEKITFGENAYDNRKTVSINLNRYDKYKNQESMAYLNQQQLKSYLHETNHALFGLDDVKDYTIHAAKRPETTLLERILIFRKYLGNKYPNIISESKVKNVIENRALTYFGYILGNKDFNEGFVEMLAVKNSDLLNDPSAYRAILLSDDLGIGLPDSFNQYGKYMRFFYHISNLVSKKSMFSTQFFQNDDIIKEFANEYESMINKYWNTYDLSNNYGSYSSSYERFKLILDKAISVYGFYSDLEGLKKNNYKEYEITKLATNVLEDLFCDCYKQKISSNDQSITSEQLKCAYNLSILEKDEKTNSWKNSKSREAYRDMYNKVKNTTQVDQVNPVQTIQPPTFSNNLLEFYKPENLWSYALSYQKIPQNIPNREILTAARDIAKICAIPVLDKATSNPSQRELDDEYVEVYNLILQKCLLCFENSINGDRYINLSYLMSSIWSDSRSFSNSNIYKYMSIIFSNQKDKVVNRYNDYLNFENVWEKFKNFIDALDKLVEIYGIEQVKNSLLENTYSSNPKKH